MSERSNATAGGTPVQSTVVWRAVTLLELLANDGEGIGVREAARRTGIDRSAVSRLLAQFEQLGCVEQVGERGVYTVGPRLFSMAAALRGRDSLWNAAEPIVRALVARNGETCYLAVRQGDRIVFREKVDSQHTIRYVIELGKSFPLTTGAAGTAILSALLPQEAEDVLAQGWEHYTDASFTDAESYRKQLERDRELGFSVSAGRWVRNGAGVASPFFDFSGACVGALTISGPADRLEPSVVPQMGRSVRQASRELSHRLGYQGRWGPAED